MTDLLSIMFLVGLSLVMTLAALILKNTVFCIVSGLGWALIGMYCFNLAASGDIDYGYFTWGFGFFATILSLSMFFSSWWIHRKTTIKLAKGGGFYDEEGGDDFKEIAEIYKIRSDRKKLRGGR